MIVSFILCMYHTEMHIHIYMMYVRYVRSTIIKSYNITLCIAVSESHFQYLMTFHKAFTIPSAGNGI